VETVRRKKKPKFLIVGVLLILGCAVGCTDGDALFRDFVDLPAAGWERDSAVQFDASVTDTAQPYVMLVSVRHTQAYPYRNLYLGRQIIGADGIEYQDTVEIQLADDRGTWLGEGVGGIKTLTVPFRGQAVSFQKAGPYRFRFQHVMRENPLPGVRSVGFTIEPADASRR
jgi:gliding motility-associated lipoprotein GldH